MKKSSIVILAVFLLGSAIGLVADEILDGKEKRENHFYLQRMYPDANRLVNPLIQIEVPPGGDSKLESIRRDIEKYIAVRTGHGDASHVAVYLRDLNKGLWVGINEDDTFVAASIVKIPILFAYLVQAQRDGAILDRKIRTDYDEAYVNSLTQNILPRKSVERGREYTIDELLCDMIVYSDNKAECTLYQNLNLSVMKQVYADLQLPPDLEQPEHTISAKRYATLFRTLYNATYLNKDWSERALALLTKTDFRDGIVAGVPSNVTVAHKFAERAYALAGSNQLVGDRQLHDCGIVYHPHGPYLICVMTKGRDLETLKGLIKDISRIAYKQM